MQHPDDFYVPRFGHIDQRVGEARHDTFAGSWSDAWSKLQVEGGDLLGLGQDGVHCPIGNRFARFFQVVGFDGLYVPARPCGVVKPLFCHDGLIGA